MITMRDSRLTRRRLLQGVFASSASLILPGELLAQSATQPFEQWVTAFRAKALARGISGATYDRVMSGLKPDMGVFALQREDLVEHAAAIAAVRAARVR